jgi:hypothetical protein
MNPLALLLLALLPSLGFVVGVLLGRGRNPAELGRQERHELNSQRLLIGDLTAMAGEHAGLGDPFAVQALDRINQHRREIT